MNYELIFDGGAIGNPGRGYGSYRMSNLDTGTVVLERIRFSDFGKITNNEAEHLTLVQALHRIRSLITDDRLPTSALTIKGDSQLVIKHLTGEFNANPPLSSLVMAERRLLDGIQSWTAEWIPREVSVAIFGH